MEQEASEELKKEFVKYSFLVYPNVTEEFSVNTDASGNAIGVVHKEPESMRTCLYLK